MITQKNILELKIRQDIYGFINKNPGLHLREISRKMNILLITIRYHLKYLEKQGLIETKSLDGFKRYYVTNKFSTKEKEIINLLRQEVPRKILLYMGFFLFCSQIKISKEFRKHPSTIDFHLKKLKKLGIIEEVYEKEIKIRIEDDIIIKQDKMRNERTYMFKDMEVLNAIYKFLIICKNSFSDKDAINDLFIIQKEILNRSKKDVIKGKSHIYKKVNTLDCALDNVLKFYSEVFPNPYSA